MIWFLLTVAIWGLATVFHFLQARDEIQRIMGIPARLESSAVSAWNKFWLRLFGFKAAIIGFVTSIYMVAGEVVKSLNADALQPYMGIHWAALFGDRAESFVILGITLLVTYLTQRDTKIAAKTPPQG
jgi:hypothetical protein